MNLRLYFPSSYILFSLFFFTLGGAHGGFASSAESIEATVNKLKTVFPEDSRLLEGIVTCAHEKNSQQGPKVKAALVENKIQQTVEMTAFIQERLNKTKNRMLVISQSTVVGLFLRKEKKNLPNAFAIKRELSKYPNKISNIQLRIAQLEELLLLVSREPIRYKSRIFSEKKHINSSIDPKIETLMNETCGILVNEYNDYFDKLMDLIAKQRVFLAAIEEFNQFINQHVLWRPNHKVFEASDIVDMVDAWWWLLPNWFWSEFYGGMKKNSITAIIIIFISLLIFGSISLYRKKMVHYFKTVKQYKERHGYIRYRQAGGLFGATVLLALPIPVLLGCVSLLFGMTSKGLEVSFAIHQGFFNAAVIFLSIEIIKQFFREGGIARVIFAWEKTVIVNICQSLSLSRWAVPFIALFTVFNAQANEAYSSSLGRLSFMIAAFIFALAIRKAFGPHSACRKHVQKSLSHSWFSKACSIIYSITIMTPLLLIIITFLGYSLTALEISWRLLLQCLVIFAISSFYITLSQGSFHAHRFSERIREKLQIKQLLFYLAAILVLVSIWYIWVDLLPALQIISDLEVWSIAYKISDSVGLASEAAASLKSTLAITIGDILFALLTIAFTALIVKHAPSLLEITVLNKLPVDHGIQYAVSMIVRYTFVIIGVVIAFSFIGITWSKVQWLAAAVSVGLGFGLQEIFANFISGLIILLERPLRVGDIVTVGETSGKVTRIRMRATTITDWDRKELIVPNKEFITGRLVNWSLSDKILRIIIPVGIAYGSDTELAQKLLLEVATNNEYILDDPQPTAHFVSFGSSSLDFEMRVFIPDINNWFPAKHSLHMEIDQAFRKAGIEIAFPQRDVHIRTVAESAQTLPG